MDPQNLITATLFISGFGFFSQGWNTKLTKVIINGAIRYQSPPYYLYGLFKVNPLELIQINGEWVLRDSDSFTPIAIHKGSRLFLSLFWIWRISTFSTIWKYYNLLSKSLLVLNKK